MPERAAYGSWKSPISAELAAGGSKTFAGLALDSTDLYWVETRPTEGGRAVLMRKDAAGAISEGAPPGSDIRTAVHEYGGGAFAVDSGTLCFTLGRDQRLYAQEPGRSPECLTPYDGYRYADLIFDHRRNRLLCVREDHTRPGEPINAIVAVGLSGGGDGKPVALGNDFYSTARLSPDGNQLAYLTWNHPNMPWDGTELHLARLAADGGLVEDRCIAGGATEAIFQPEWSPDGTLHFVAEHTGWWNIYRWQHDAAQALCPMQAEFGRAMWLFGYSTYGFVDDQTILCCYTESGIDKLALLDAGTGRLERIECPYTEIDFLRCDGAMAAFVGGSPTRPYTVAALNLRTRTFTAVRQAFEVEIDEAFISIPQELRFQTSGGAYAHALYYPPRSRDYGAPREDRPPLIVLGHGGPTSAASTSLRYAMQFWTSRGFGVADVNYRGSTGYGRDYRQSLNGQWGIADVDDCCNAALALVEAGLADRRRLIIKGRSAGGFIVFCCLAFHLEVFAAGVSHCGVADLEIFTRDTHKFEAHYLETLVGPYPDRRDAYEARSPIHFTESLRSPLIMFQGAEDKVVPPEQSSTMHEVLRRKGIPTALEILEGEGHVFRSAKSWKRLHEGELYFLSKVLDLRPADELAPLRIENV